MAYLIVLAAALARFLPHTVNFSPVYGALLYGGARLKSRDFLWYPVTLLALSDLVLLAAVYHTRPDWSEPVLWAAYGALAMIGRGTGRRFSTVRVIGLSAAAAVAFFLISNLGVWLGWHMYPATLAGLMDCYVTALPFFRFTLASALLYALLLFGGEEFYRRRVARRVVPQG